MLFCGFVARHEDTIAIVTPVISGRLDAVQDPAPRMLYCCVPLNLCRQAGDKQRFRSVGLMLIVLGRWKPGRALSSWIVDTVKRSWESSTLTAHWLAGEAGGTKSQKNSHGMVLVMSRCAHEGHQRAAPHEPHQATQDVEDGQLGDARIPRNPALQNFLAQPSEALA